jgi:hypothetical protein
MVLLADIVTESDTNTITSVRKDLIGERNKIYTRLTQLSANQDYTYYKTNIKPKPADRARWMRGKNTSSEIGELYSALSLNYKADDKAQGRIKELAQAYYRKQLLLISRNTHSPPAYRADHTQSQCKQRLIMDHYSRLSSAMDKAWRKLPLTIAAELDTWIKAGNAVDLNVASGAEPGAYLRGRGRAIVCLDPDLDDIALVEVCVHEWIHIWESFSSWGLLAVRYLKSRQRSAQPFLIEYANHSYVGDRYACRHSEVLTTGLTAILTGNRDYELLLQDQEHYAFCLASTA